MKPPIKKKPTKPAKYWEKSPWRRQRMAFNPQALAAWKRRQGE